MLLHTEDIHPQVSCRKEYEELQHTAVAVCCC